MNDRARPRELGVRRHEPHPGPRHADAARARRATSPARDRRECPAMRHASQSRSITPHAMPSTGVTRPVRRRVGPGDRRRAGDVAGRDVGQVVGSGVQDDGLADRAATARSAPVVGARRRRCRRPRTSTGGRSPSWWPWSSAPAVQWPPTFVNAGVVDAVAAPGAVAGVDVEAVVGVEALGDAGDRDLDVGAARRRRRSARRRRAGRSCRAARRVARQPWPAAWSTLDHVERRGLP